MIFKYTFSTLVYVNKNLIVTNFNSGTSLVECQSDKVTKFHKIAIMMADRDEHIIVTHLSQHSAVIVDIHTQYTWPLR